GRLVSVSSIHRKRPFSHLRMVVTLALAIVSRGGLVQSCAFLYCRTIAFKPLFHSFSFLLDFFASWTRLLQIGFAEAFDLRRSGLCIDFDLITKRLQFLG